jgi:hypothetical protein
MSVQKRRNVPVQISIGNTFKRFLVWKKVLYSIDETGIPPICNLKVSLSAQQNPDMSSHFKCETACQTLLLLACCGLGMHQTKPLHKMANTNSGVPLTKFDPYPNCWSMLKPCGLVEQRLTQAALSTQKSKWSASPKAPLSAQSTQRNCNSGLWLSSFFYVVIAIPCRIICVALFF